MAQQDYPGPVHWHVVDDGFVPLPMYFAHDWITLHPYRLPPMDGNSQARNLRFLLEQVDPYYPTVIWEDDDYYAPDWLSTMANMSDQAELVGESQARYYHVPRRIGRQLRNTHHASLCATAIRDGAWHTLYQSCLPGKQYIDMDLWKAHAHQYLFTGHRVIGMKGLPGRPGIGMGHQSSFTGIRDPEGTLLQQWMGDDAHTYLSLEGLL